MFSFFFFFCFFSTFCFVRYSLSIKPFTLFTPITRKMSDNGTCVIYLPLHRATWIVGLILLITLPLSITTMLIHFLINKNNSVLLRKRSFTLTFISACGAYSLVLSIFFNSIVALPCWLRGLFDAGK